MNRLTAGSIVLAGLLIAAAILGHAYLTRFVALERDPNSGVVLRLDRHSGDIVACFPHHVTGPRLVYRCDGRPDE